MGTAFLACHLLLLLLLLLLSGSTRHCGNRLPVLRRTRPSLALHLPTAYMHDMSATAVVTVSAFYLVRSFDILTKREFIEQILQGLLKGPLYYVVVLMFCALFFWRDSPVEVTSPSMMSAGDGFADIMERRFGRIKFPYNKKKKLGWKHQHVCFWLLLFYVDALLLFGIELFEAGLEWDCKNDGNRFLGCNIIVIPSNYRVPGR